VADLFQVPDKFPHQVGSDLAQRQLIQCASAALDRKGKKQHEGVAPTLLGVE
jgi:hypothetical protein